MASSSESSGGQDPAPNEKQRRDMACVEGVYLPPKNFGRVRMEQHINDLRGMKLRDDDIFLCAYPKAGTHWLWEVLSMLRQGNAGYDSRRKVQLMMEFVDVDKLDEQPSPRILNTHLPFFMLPVQEMRTKRTKIVHVYRNPKDVIVSMHFMAKSGDFQIGDLDFPSFVDHFWSDKAAYCGYFGYLRQMHDFIQVNPDVPVFTLSYEDMKKDPASTIRRVAEFLEVDASEQLCQDIAQACSFQKMKSNEEEKAPIQFGGGDEIGGKGKGKEQQGAVSVKKPVIFRKGEIGDWKNYLTVAMSEKVDAIIEDKIKGLPFTLQFT